VTYKDNLIEAMKTILKTKDVRFIGYNLKYGSKGYGTLKDIPENKIIEMPVAEALMSGISIGMSLMGFTPILIFERHDFILLALDQLVNHLDKIKEYSHNEFNPKVIIRAIVGGTSPFNPGIQHKADYTEALKKLLKLKIINLQSKNDILPNYINAINSDSSILLIEYRNLYDQ